MKFTDEEIEKLKSGLKCPITGGEMICVDRAEMSADYCVAGHEDIFWDYDNWTDTFHTTYKGVRRHFELDKHNNLTEIIYILS